METSLLAANPPGAKPQTPRATAAIRHSTEDEAIIDNACLDPKLRKALIEAGRKYEFIGVQWVDYIVTTANSWKTPIKDFELVLEKPELKDKNFHEYLSLCWDGPLQRVNERRSVARVKDFVPAKDLHIVFFALSEH
jgi:hypothetical protein